MDLDANFLSQFFGIATAVLFMVAAILDRDCALGFAVISIGWLWFVLTSGVVVDPDTQKNLTVARGLFFRSASFVGAVLIVGSHVYQRLKL